jgi:hypothetical protein
MSAPIFCSSLVDKLTHRVIVTLPTDGVSSTWLRGLGRRRYFRGPARTGQIHTTPSDKRS